MKKLRYSLMLFACGITIGQLVYFNFRLHQVVRGQTMQIDAMAHLVGKLETNCSVEFIRGVCSQQTAVHSFFLAHGFKSVFTGEDQEDMFATAIDIRKQNYGDPLLVPISPEIAHLAEETTTRKQ